MTDRPSFSPPARSLIVLGALALVLALLKVGAPVLSPLLMAVFVATVSAPPLRWLRRLGIPKWIALAAVVFVLLDIGSLLALITTGAVEGFRDSLPSYHERFLLLSEQLGGWLEGVGVAGSKEAIPDLMDPGRLTPLVSMILSNAGSVLATGVLVLLATVFILLEAPGIPAKLRAAFDIDAAHEARIERLLSSVNRYMVIKTLTSLGTAVCVWLMLKTLGIDFAVLWAVLAFFFNFLPVVGNILMMIPAVLLAVIQTDIRTALLVAVGYLVINTAIGSVLEPRIMGKGLGVSTLAVFISLMFWGWLFGTTGMFLAVPLTSALVIAFDASRHTRPLAIVLGPEIEELAGPEPEEDTPDDKLGPGAGKDG